MNVLVTGGAGFIGSNFIRYWLRNHKKDIIVNLDKLTYAGHLSSTSDFAENRRYRFIKGDICNSVLVNRIIKGIDVVVHFAAESHVDRSIHKSAPFIRTNILGTHTLLEACLKNKVKRFHHVSTDEVFGSLSLKSRSKFSELTPYNPKSPYSASKASSDHLVRAYFHTFGLPITITNCSNNFGPFQDPEKMIPRFITNLLTGKKVPVYGDGKYVRDWLYVEDHVRAIESVILGGRVGETYCVGGQKKLVNNLGITGKILKILGMEDSWIEHVKDRPGHDRKYSVDWSKINKELSWKPLHNFDTWLAKTILWYKENEWWWRPLKFKSENFYKSKQR